jgi:hypothetical protein
MVTPAYDRPDVRFCLGVMMREKTLLLIAGMIGGIIVTAPRVRGQESVWIEAEHMQGIQDYCWPGGSPQNCAIEGQWGMSGPGWAAEWTQGGESGFLSIACKPDEDRAVATRSLVTPVSGRYRLWIRYADAREKTERFDVQIEQPGSAPWKATYGQMPVVEEDNEMKLYWNWAFGWDYREVDLKAGPAVLSLRSAYKEPAYRQIDCLVLTTDTAYRPLIKDRPRNYAWDYLASLRQTPTEPIQPLARRRPPTDIPEAWKLHTFRDKGFVYLWNVENAKWAGDDPGRVLYPYHVGDADVRAAFEKKYGGKKDVPIFSDPRIVPTFHSSGPVILQTDSPNKDQAEDARRFVRWLDADPNRLWATMMNYAGDAPITHGAVENFSRYRDRYVAAISGENTGYFDPYIKGMDEASRAQTRRQVAEVFNKAFPAANASKYRVVFGKDLEDPYREVTACLSCAHATFVPLLPLWGARNIGYESSVVAGSLLNMRWAFMRGAARQHQRLTATYRSCNFGDSATIFSQAGSFSSPRNILDNYYSVYSGAGMTWYKFDLWYQYMAGSSMFYHEQGFDEFWMPGGTAVAGVKEIQLSPKGKLVDRFLRSTAAFPDRGTPYTPVAFLLDYAHGWEPATVWPTPFGHMTNWSDRMLVGDHEHMLRELFWAAYYPMGPISQNPITAVSEVDLPGIFGDIFDVIFAYPDVKLWTTIDSYPVVIVAGDIELTEAEGLRMKRYVEAGGTLLITDAQLTGPGAATLEPPSLGQSAETAGYSWMGKAPTDPSQRYAFRPIEGGTVIATTPEGQPICSSFDRGQGRLIMLSVPRGLGIDRQITPMMTRLMAHLTAGLMPVEVRGDVQWLVNRSDKGWLVTLLNPYGQNKPQQGISPTDYRQNRAVTIRAHVPVHSARDRLLPEDRLTVQDAPGGIREIPLTVQAGGVRVIQLE